jgi:ABC-type Fe3+ transport system permease subunit
VVRRAGRAVPPPADAAAVWRHTLCLALATTGGTVLVVLLVHAAVRRAADRRRLREWDRDWARVEPGWSRRV